MIAKLCTISCVTSLLTIAAMSINRYLYVCHNDLYKKIFSTKRTSLVICMSVYCVGLLLVLLNQAGIGDHGFDRKSLDCIWDRMATYPYTVVYSVTLVLIPSIVIGICYLRLYIFVNTHKKKMNNYNKRNATLNSGSGLPPNPKLQLAKTFILIYAVFVTCWFPYALLIVIDHKDEFMHELHVYLTVWAHMHPSLNWLIYYFTQPKYKAAYRTILDCGRKDISRNLSSPLSHQNSSDRSRDSDKNKPERIFHVSLEARDAVGTSENHYMEWKPIEKGDGAISIATIKETKSDNNNGNGIYRKLYEEIRNIHSEGEVQIFVRGCSLKSKYQRSVRAHSAADLADLDEIDRARYRSSGRQRRSGIAGGVMALNDHSTAILGLIDKVCDSQNYLDPSIPKEDADKIFKTCADTLVVKSANTESGLLDPVDNAINNDTKEGLKPAKHADEGTQVPRAEIADGEIVSVEDIEFSSESGITVIETTLATLSIKTKMNGETDKHEVDSPESMKEIIQDIDASETL